jgi:hypothetical protein
MITDYDHFQSMYVAMKEIVKCLLDGTVCIYVINPVRQHHIPEQLNPVQISYTSRG